MKTIWTWDEVVNGDSYGGLESRAFERKGLASLPPDMHNPSLECPHADKKWLKNYVVAIDQGVVTDTDAVRFASNVVCAPVRR
jgi:hypothetical protein